MRVDRTPGATDGVGGGMLLNSRFSVGFSTVSNPPDVEDMTGLPSVLDDTIGGRSVTVPMNDLRVATLRADDANRILHTESPG